MNFTASVVCASKEVCKGNIMSKAHYSVNDDVYGKILKTSADSKPQTDYADVFEAVEGLGTYIFIIS